MRFTRFLYTLKKYGITLDQYHALSERQDFGCAICGDVVERFHVDHSHTTGRVRGLLCGNCNTGIGLLKDDPVIVAKAVEYLSAA